ncbi:MAG: phage Gp37/Gp68 family protein [Firmicutes bacterium]|nr:phage Gp37/Gp68 family protein [Dethiobacter sp.]MBS3887764.1 phage Gp37/Gp68 family protein [Bacillota bacterium]MBS4054797.1 phage Gp37/Gp68 family protein [Thermaerobacter sp.]
MSAKSKIEWTENTWNPVTGCTRISDGCKNCYAYTMANRLMHMGSAKYEDGFSVRTHESALDEPLKWRKPRLVFVNSMSDLFHEDIPFRFIEQVFEVMNKAPMHTFQILTKRALRLAELAPQLNWTPNIWQGVTVESSEHKYRVDALRTVASAVRFISFEPLLNDIGAVNLSGIQWSIVGGESGPGARPMESDWVLNLKEQCDQQVVPFYFKQWGGTHKKKAGRILLGQTWDNMPIVSSASN